MKMFRVHSTVIASAGYDALCKTLDLQFTVDGQTYRYYDVPEHVWYGMRSAQSIDTYFHTYIMGHYEEAPL